MLRMARAMHSESPTYAPHPFDEDVFLQWVGLCRDNDDWLCLIAWNELDPVGFVAIGAVPMLFSHERSVDDLGFFVMPKWRGTTAAIRLYRSMEPWAKSKGAVIRMGITTGTNQDQAARFFKRFGFEQTGILLTKKLS